MIRNGHKLGGSSGIDDTREGFLKEVGLQEQIRHRSVKGKRTIEMD